MKSKLVYAKNCDDNLAAHSVQSVRCCDIAVQFGMTQIPSRSLLIDTYSLFFAILFL